MRRIGILVGLVFVAACADLLGPAEWHGNYGTHDLIRWDDEAVPTTLDANSSRIVSGCVMLNTRDRFTDVYVTEYLVNGVAKLQRDTVVGTWKLVRDTVYFSAGDLSYSAPYDTVQHSFTLTWFDYQYKAHHFVYHRKGACR